MFSATLWPSGEVDVASSKQQFESMIYRPKESDVDLDAWASLANLVFPLCHSDSPNGNTLPEQHAVSTGKGYRYTATDGICAPSRYTVGMPQGGVVGYVSVSKDNEQAMMSAVAQQPASIAIEGGQSPFQFYWSSVLTALCGTRLDYGVLAVGYGTDAGTDYWKVNWPASLSWVTGVGATTGTESDPPETACIANAVSVFEAFGVETAYSHQECLERAQEVGLFAISGFTTNLVCDAFDGYQS